MATLEELLDFLLIDGGSVALFDATNTTLPRRRAVVERVKQRAEDLVEILFLESQCFDEEVRATVRNGQLLDLWLTISVDSCSSPI